MELQPEPPRIETHILKTEEYTPSMEVPTSSLYKGTFDKPHAGVTGNALLLIQVLVGYVVLIPLLDELQKFVIVNVFPKSPFINTLTATEPNNVNPRDRIISNSLENDFSSQTLFLEKTSDIIFLIYLFEKQKMTKNQVFSILKKKYNVAEDICEALVIKKEGLLHYD